MTALGILLHAADGHTWPFVKMIGHVLLQFQEPLEVVNVVGRFVNDHLAFGFVGRIGILAFRRLVGRGRIRFLSFQQRILVQLGIDASL